MAYLQLLFKPITSIQSDILVAQLSEIGFEGFEEEDGELKAFIQETAFKEALITSLHGMQNVKYVKSTIGVQNWNSVWEANFEPISVTHPTTADKFAYIRANFHQPSAKHAYELIITPKMSFGTGHHATTYLMMQYMSTINFNYTHVIDFGTGTGVLAILAEKLGASRIEAIDNDDWSIANAAENVAMNSCKYITLQKASTIAYNAEKADIMLANINLNIITENISEIINAVAESGLILFSGIMLHDEQKMIQLMHNEHLQINSTYKKGDWFALHCTKK